ncbi:efflux RND transporter periplasmic adaptor subunit [Ferrimonas gelatinilytica]|uniref:Efflux RND transporter periplasmic adaptor subunit n=1 Tax=Ferrimonas gelatinilytica TaxID=1255257 RepID=A0ABP9RZC4_9GAMM
METFARIFLALSLTTLTACLPKEQADTPPQATPVRVVPVHFSDHYPVTHRFVGQIRNAATSELGFELPGMVEQIGVQVGDTVVAGQALARLDTALLNTEAKQLRAGLVQVEAERDLVLATQKRQQTLGDQGYQSQQQLDELRSQKQRLDARLLELQAALEANTLRREKSILRAPFAGRVAQRQLAPGQVVAAGQPVLTLVPTEGAEAKIGIPVDLLRRLPPGQPYQLSHRGQPLTATLLGRGAEVDATTRTVPLRFALPGDGDWLNGDLIYLSLEQRMTHRAMAVSPEVLLAGLRGQWNVLVAKQAPDGEHHLERRDVTLLHTEPRRVYLDGALKEGEWLVVAGLHTLVQGQRVKPQTLPAEEPTP